MNKLFPLESQFFESSRVWALRISNVENLSLETTALCFPKNIFGRCIVSEETSSKGVLHHHILLSTDKDDKLVNSDFMSMIQTQYADAKGNKCVYTRPADNKKQLLKYTLKEGKFLQWGFSSDYIAAALACSSKKEGMDEQFNTILEQFNLSDEHDALDVYISRYIKLKIKHNQPLYNQHLIAYFRMVQFKRQLSRSETNGSSTDDIDQYVRFIKNKTYDYE